MNIFKRRVFFVASISLVFSISSANAEKYDQPANLRASQFIPASMMGGPNHQVDEKVANDGFLNMYTINSRFGTLKATSTLKLFKYINELNAVAAIEQAKASGQFKEGVKEKAGDVIDGAKSLVYDPIGTVGGVASGVGKLFSRGKENLFGGSRSDAESSRMKDIMGFSKAKREYAHEFGVDVYSRNKILQDKLDDISWSGYAGGISATVALMAVPGGAVSVLGTTETLNEIYRDSAPADLRIMNRKKLMALGVSEDITDLFVSNAVFTPREQTAIVLSLEKMGKVKNPGTFVKLSVLTDDADIAFFRQKQAEMYANYDQKIEPIVSFVQLGQAVAAKTRSGKLVFNVPLDYLLWTRGIAALGRAVSQNASLMKGVKERHIWLTGDVSPMARKELEKMGWNIHTRATNLL
ncbi:MAG: hypothetical protein O6928_05940 [Gammaproteobacteria bacterium]|nr:hypothetical protein [Gammaproteobacteria bacterium]